MAYCNHTLGVHLAECRNKIVLCAITLYGEYTVFFFFFFPRVLGENHGFLTRVWYYSDLKYLHFLPGSNRLPVIYRGGPLRTVKIIIPVLSDLDATHPAAEAGWEHSLCILPTNPTSIRNSHRNSKGFYRNAPKQLYTIINNNIQQGFATLREVDIIHTHIYIKVT